MTFSIFNHVQFNKTGRAICPSCLITKGEGYRKYNLAVSLEAVTHGAYHCHRGCTTQQIKDAIGVAPPIEKTYVPTPQPPKEIDYKRDDQISIWTTTLHDPNGRNAPEALQYLQSRGLSIQTIERFKLGFTYRKFEFDGDWRATPCIVIPYEISQGEWLAKYFPNKWLPESERPDQQTAQPFVTARWYFTNEPTTKTLWICEGEWDALLLGQHIRENNLSIAVCTATCGAGSIPKDLSPLDKFEKIVIFYDLDDAGINGAAKLKKVLGDRAFIAQLPSPLDHKKGFDLTDGFKLYLDKYLSMLQEISTPSFKPQPQPQQNDYQDLFLSPKQREMRNLRAIYAPRLRKNMRGNVVELDGVTVQPDYLYLQCLERDGVEVKKDQIIDAFLFFASENEYDPVAEYLNNCYANYGDKTEHLLTNASDIYMGTKEYIYNIYIRKTLIGAVRRTFEPGCQFETALVLYGKQGAFKSTFWRVLGGDWFDDTVQGFDRDEKQKLHQYWIEEFGEIEKVSNKHDVSQIKAFMSNRNDVFRVPFGRSSKSYPRKFIIVGSTNKPDILQDATGDRRFWIIKIDQPIDIDKVREERDQLWAAAVSLYKKGESAFLPRDIDAVREEMNKEYRADDPWEEPVTNYIEFLNSVKMIDILKSGLDIPLERHDRRSQDRVATILRNLGWVKTHTMNGKVWKKQESDESLGHKPYTEQSLPMTYINKEESFNNNGSSNCNDSMTHDSYDPTKLDYLQNPKKEKTFEVGDLVRIKSPHFLAGKKGKILYINANDPNTQITVCGDDWAVNAGFKFEQLEAIR